MGKSTIKFILLRTKIAALEHDLSQQYVMCLTLGF